MPDHFTQHSDPLAEDRLFDTAVLVRLGLWGSAAAAALLAVALATQTGAGQRRAAIAYGSLTGSAQLAELDQQRRSAARQQEAEIEIRRLTDALRNLSGDRDQLSARLTALERSYEDVTGSIGRLSTGAKLSEIGSPSTPPNEPAPAATERSTAAAPPDAADGVSVKTEFGVDLGGAPTLAALRAAWNQIRRNHASLLDGLRPVIGIRDGKGGQADLRLVVGPISNAGAAAKLCATLAAAGLSCQPTMFDGQRLALR